MGCLPASCTSQELQKYFTQFGHISNVQVMRKGKNICSGNAIVQCSRESTYSLILESNDLYIKGRAIFCEPVLTGEALHTKNLMLSYRRVFVSNLPLNMSDNTIKQVFTQFGLVQNAYRIRSMANEDRPFGFVTFHDYASADLAASYRKIHYKSTTLYISRFQKHKSLLEKPPAQQTALNSSQQQQLCLRNDANSGITGHFNCPNSTEVTKFKKKVPRRSLNKPDESYFKEEVSKRFSLDHQACKPNTAVYHKESNQRTFTHHDEWNIRFNIVDKRSMGNLELNSGNIRLRILDPRNNTATEQL